MSDLESISLSISRDDLQEEMSISYAALEEARSQKQESISNEQIKKGDSIIGTYEVTSDAISGGMGSVWKVYHKDWNTDLAMKRPQPRFFAEGSEKRKEAFIKECENWINLGLHPNIVSCYYVREIGGVPTIFSEWMDGGSLKDRISDGSLYEGTVVEVEKRLFDIAIQMARGICYSHDHGLIHQDVKPGNILLTPKWEAKVADFGLAQAWSQFAEEETIKFSGYTLEYCPKEQAEGKKPADWMDAYAWAVTVLEMYLGKRMWKEGSEVAEHWREYLEQAKVAMPGPLWAAIKHSLYEWEDDGMLRDNILLPMYKESLGIEYKRPEPEAQWNSPLSLNNRALSLLVLGREKQASALLERASHMLWFGENPAKFNRLILGREKTASFEKKIFLEDKKSEPYWPLLLMHDGETEKAEKILSDWGENIPESAKPYVEEIKEAISNHSEYRAPYVLAHFQTEEEIQREKDYYAEASAKMDKLIEKKDFEGANALLMDLRANASDGHLDEVASISAKMSAIALPKSIHAIYPINISSSYAYKVENKDHKKSGDTIQGEKWKYEIKRKEKACGTLKEVGTLEPEMSRRMDQVFVPDKQELDIYNRFTGEYEYSISLPGQTAYFQVLRGEKKAILVTTDDVYAIAKPEYITRKRSEDFSNKKCDHDFKYKIHNKKKIAENFIMYEIDLETTKVKSIGKGVSVLRLELNTQPKGAPKGTKTKVFHPGGYLLWKDRIKVVRKYSYAGSDNVLCFIDESTGKMIKEWKLPARREDVCMSEDGRYLLLNQEMYLLDWDWEKGPSSDDLYPLKIRLDEEDCKKFVSANTGVEFGKEGKGFLFWKK